MTELGEAKTKNDKKIDKTDKAFMDFELIKLKTIGSTKSSADAWKKNPSKTKAVLIYLFSER